jgi:hypothetical protein
LASTIAFSGIVQELPPSSEYATNPASPTTTTRYASVESVVMATERKFWAVLRLVLGDVRFDQVSPRSDDFIAVPPSPTANKVLVVPRRAIALNVVDTPDVLAVQVLPFDVLYTTPVSPTRTPDCANASNAITP